MAKKKIMFEIYVHKKYIQHEFRLARVKLFSVALYIGIFERCGRSYYKIEAFQSF